MAEIVVDGLESLLSAFDEIAKTLQKRQETAVMQAGLAYQHDVQAYPPPVDTGQYRAGIRTELSSEYGVPVALIGSPAPQACRLEFGFIGADSLGRIYHQAARPHWRPALDYNREKYQNIIVEELFK